MQLRLSGLWQYRDFLTFWAGQTISAFGTQVTVLALPLTAVLVLGAGPVQMGLLTAVETAPTLLIGLLAGALADRSRKRPLLLVSNLGRGVVLTWVPLGHILGVLTIEQLYAVGFLAGALSTLSGAAYSPFLLEIVQRDRILDANRKLSLSDSAANISGPGLAGLLVQAITAPLAIAVDAASFFVSAASVALVRTRETVAHSDEAQQGIWREITDGLRLLVGNRMLRGMAGTNATWGFFDNVMLAVLVLYAVRELKLSPALLGLSLVGGPIGFLLGNLLITRITSALGFGPAMVWAAVVGSAGGVLLALTSGPIPLAVSVLAAAEFVMGLGGGLYSITARSLQQVVTPDRLLGRMNASMSFLSASSSPLGALAGGLLGQAIGLRPTLVVGAVGGVAGFLWVWFSPLRTLREQPRATQPEYLLPD